MKQKLSLFLAVVTSISLMPAVSSCNKGVDDKKVVNNGDELEYIVKFNSNYKGGPVTKKVVEAGKTVTLPEEPTRVGYIFSGWYHSYRADAGESEKFDATQPIHSDQTLFAKWARNNEEHSVTFHYNDGSTPDKTQAVSDGTRLTKPEDPIYPDGTMRFSGWYTDQSYTTLYSFDSKVKSDLDLYAKWAISKAVVTFDYNYTNSPSSLVLTVDIDQAMTSPEAPTREHYAFLGWYDKRVDGTIFDFSNPITGDMTLYAHWEQSEFQINFDLNGATAADGTATSSYFRKGTSAKTFADDLASKLSYVGHDFKGWFKSKLDTDTDTDSTTGQTQVDFANISESYTVYAGWALSSYTVSFDLGYEGATGVPQTQTVKYGKTATEPTAPTREGYIFSGWYSDTALSTQFTFDMQVTSNLNLHAKWLEDSSVKTNVTVTYYVGSSVYATKTIDFNSTAKSDAPADPTKTNALFDGWYTDASFTKTFNMNANLTEDVSVYAKFLDRYTFEAESIDFTGKSGQGTSTNSYEEQMIMSYSYIKDGSPQTVSNSYFVRELYYNGASLDFIIESDRDVDDAVLYLRVSSESYQFMTTKTKNGKTYNYLSDTEFIISINGSWDGDTPTSWLSYDGLYMPMANTISPADLDRDKTPFEDCYIASKIHLDKGSNAVSLFVNNNNNHGGTFHAEAPIIDCMYFYTSASLSATDYEFYKKPGVQKG